MAQEVGLGRASDSIIMSEMIQISRRQLSESKTTVLFFTAALYLDENVLKMHQLCGCFMETRLDFVAVKYSCQLFRVPTRPGKPGKMRVHLENLEISWNFEKFNKYHGKMT